MKKRVLALVMSTAMIASVLTACGGNNNAPAADNTGADSNATTDNNTADNNTGEESKPSGVAPGENEIVVWVAEATTDFTSKKLEEFKAANPDYAGYSIRVEPMSEGEAAGNMVTDVDSGADIFSFAQDQMSRLVMAGAVMPISASSEATSEYAKWIEEQNNAGTVAGSKVGDTLYAFPITSDNGYFMYYDKSVVTDPTSLDAVLADCEAAGKNFYMSIANGWYNPAFFFGTGCTLTYETDSEGNYTACDIDYASANGVKALKGMVNMHKSKAFVDNAEVDKATSLGAIVTGTWAKDGAKEKLGDNFACAKLPEFTVDGENFQMSGFNGFKLLGVKPQTDENKMKACLAMAQFLSGEEVQKERFEEFGWGPSNNTVAQSDAVKSDEALSALSEQFAYTIPQGQYPDEYWPAGEALGGSVNSGDYDNASDDELMKVLEDFEATCKSYAE